MSEFEVELGYVLQRLDCARACLDDQSLLEACAAIGHISNFPSFYEGSLDLVEKMYSSQNYHEFVRDMMSNPDISSKSKLIETLYITFEKIIKTLTQKDLEEKVYSPDYIDFFVTCFIRDTDAFKSLAVRITKTTCFYISKMTSIESISILKELDFHRIVANLLSECNTPKTICMTMRLLTVLINRYGDHLKVAKPFIEAKVPHLILVKATQLKYHSQLCDCFNNIILKLTADKELSLELFEDGYLEELLEVFGNKSMLSILRSVIDAIGNIALGGQHVKQVLLDKHFYLSLFSILHLEMSTADSFFISACCRVLCILASGDWVKRKYVECGCIDLLLKIICHSQLSSDMLWRPLRLLSLLSSMTVLDRQFVLTSEVLETILSVLQRSSCNKVISYCTQIFLCGSRLDSRARKLRDLGVVQVVQAFIRNPVCLKGLPHLEKWGLELMEKQNLYTLSLPNNAQLSLSSKYPDNHLSDWPPYFLKVDASSPIPIPSLLSGSNLLPVDDAYFRPNTPTAPELTDLARQQLTALGLNPDKPLFRVGRLYGSTYGRCKNCTHKGSSKELVIRTLSMTIEQYQHLVDRGWHRRGGVKMFRLRHNHNMECCCWETRVLVKQFDHTKHKSYKKVLKRMPVERLTVEICHAHFSKEAFDLYNEYHVKKHDKPLKSEYSYCEHVVNTPTTYQVIDGIEYGTFHQLYRLDGKLVAVEVVDVIPKGIVSVYMWYDVNKEIAKYSFGVYSVLKDIEMVISMSEKNPKMEYYYLQGWNNNNKKLSYKANYEPEEFYCPCIVADWVPALDEVEQSKKEVIEKEALKAAEQEQSDGDGTVTEPPQKGMNGESALKVTPGNSNENESNSEPVKHVETRAFPLDMKRYEEVTGKELDISKIVICLNYTEFMYLEDLFMRYVKDNNQREIMESRFRELYVCLCPELWSQLVIDMMVSGTSPGS